MKKNRKQDEKCATALKEAVRPCSAEYGGKHGQFV